MTVQTVLVSWTELLLSKEEVGPKEAVGSQFDFLESGCVCPWPQRIYCACVGAGRIGRYRHAAVACVVLSTSQSLASIVLHVLSLH